MNYTIKVTQEDIDKGCKGNASNCPITRAVRRAIKDATAVSCFTEILILFPSNNCKSITIPKKAWNFILDFDANIPVKPFTFELTI